MELECALSAGSARYCTRYKQWQRIPTPTNREVMTFVVKFDLGYYYSCVANRSAFCFLQDVIYTLNIRDWRFEHTPLVSSVDLCGGVTACNCVKLRKNRAYFCSIVLVRNIYICRRSWKKNKKERFSSYFTKNIHQQEYYVSIIANCDSRFFVFVASYTILVSASSWLQTCSSNTFVLIYKFDSVHWQSNRS